MSKPRTYQTEAIIIKKTKLGEADSILTLYTPHLGKIQGFAKVCWTINLRYILFLVIFSEL